MKSQLIVLLLLILGVVARDSNLQAAIVSPVGGAEQVFTDSTWIVSLAGIASEKGHVLVALYKDPKTWNDPGRAFYTRKVKARKGTIDIEFAKLAPGNYAIAVVHDADDNGEMTFNMFGMPTEAYGFGNNARGVLKAPGFDESVMRFSGSGRVTIELK